MYQVKLIIDVTVLNHHNFLQPLTQGCALFYFPPSVVLEFFHRRLFLLMAFSSTVKIFSPVVVPSSQYQEFFDRRKMSNVVKRLSWYIFWDCFYPSSHGLCRQTDRLRATKVGTICSLFCSIMFHKRRLLRFQPTLQSLNFQYISSIFLITVNSIFFENGYM